MKKVLYISIYGDTIKFTQGVREGRAVCIRNYHTTTYDNSLYDTEFTNDNIERIRLELDSEGLQAKQAVISICTEGIIVKTETYPKTSLRLLDKVIKNSISDSMAAINIEDYEIRYKIVGITSENYEVMIIAIPTRQIEKAIELCNGLGLKIKTINTLPNVILGMKEDMEIENTMVIDGGKDGVHLMIFHNGKLFNYAHVPCSITDVESLECLYGEIKGYLDYYASRNSGKSIDNIITTLGGQSDTYSIASLIEKRFSIPTRIYDGNRHRINRKDIINERRINMLCAYTSNIGLMLVDKTYIVKEE